jgi:phosphomannomutase
LTQGRPLHPSILREYDIRGIIGDTLDEDDAHAIGRSFGTVMRRRGARRIAVGRDGRLSSPALEGAFIDGVLASGCDVVRTGLGPTPMLYFAEQTIEVDGGVQVTGSHNPADYNGFKMVSGHASFFGPEIGRLGEICAAGDWQSGKGSLSEVEVEDAYLARLMQGITPGAYRIGWDAGNGAGGRIIERLTALLPGEHHLLHTDIDGHFPHHHPDPTVEANLTDLKALVAANRLDFGLAFDGDADRIGVVDSRGRVIWADQLLSILAEPVLKALPGATIIGDVKCSQLLCNRVSELGGVPLLWKSGHSPIKTKMKEMLSPLAGEMSGHIFFAHDWFGFDDAIYAALRLITALDEMGGSLTALRDAMPELINTPELRFQVDDARKFAVIDEVLDRLAKRGATIDRTDGARVITPDGWWLLRASNTQDVLVARAEATDQAALDRLLTQLDEQLAKSGVTR